MRTRIFGMTVLFLLAACIETVPNGEPVPSDMMDVPANEQAAQLVGFIERVEPTVEAPGDLPCTTGYTNFDVTTAPVTSQPTTRDLFQYVACHNGNGYACSWYWRAGKYGTNGVGGTGAARVWGCLAPDGGECRAPCE